MNKLVLSRVVSPSRVTWSKLRALLKTRSRKYSSDVDQNGSRVNEINIQMLSPSLYKQIFDNPSKKVNKGTCTSTSEEVENQTWNAGQESLGAEWNDKIKEVKQHLKQHDLWGRETTVLEDLDFKLPKLHGDNIAEHFETLAKEQVKDYVELASLLQKSKLPPRPKEWQFTKGWTKYSASGQATSVPFPDDKVLVFDIETLVQEGHRPTMATAVSPDCWYSWCAPGLVEDQFHWDEGLQLDDLIPLETKKGSVAAPKGGWQKALIIGHNVGFDRSFVKEQYLIKKTNLRFLDTMSLHIAVCGLTTFQRILYQASGNNSQRKEVKQWRAKHQNFIVEDWKEVSSLNNLSDVHKLHCGGEGLDKTTRDVFVQGNMADVREQFQDLMSYCAGDVEATLDVFKVLWTEFNDRFPHPVTLSGMLEMGTGYLPVNQNWERYVKQANTTYNDLQQESMVLLMKLANDACEYLHDERYKTDPWLWDLDWSCKDMKVKAPKKPAKKRKVKDTVKEVAAEIESLEETEEAEETADDRIQRVLDIESRHHKNVSHLIGYPKWYRELCPRVTSEDWKPGPSLLSHQMRVAAKLLRLTWDSFPLYHDDTHGWGYLVPGRTDNIEPTITDIDEDEDNSIVGYPSSALHELCGLTLPQVEMTASQFENFLNSRHQDEGMESEEVGRHWEATGRNPKPVKITPLPVITKCPHKGDGPYASVTIPGCWFFKIPHKDGKGKRVGNPLSKDYLNQIEDGTLGSWSGEMARQVLRLNKACSYWKNNQKRIESQMMVWLKKGELPLAVTRSENYSENGLYGAIVPRIISSGTITRRAVEITWLTASNAYEDRVGSELKSMVQAPPGYHFVGADVDSQELWIAAVIGDAYFAQTHGCTALGWMTLQGKKADKTDLHSKVAETVGISRDHAKVFNYGRIYGAGQMFAEKLLMQFNHRLTASEAKSKAALLYSTTKGKKNRREGTWSGGSESAMFNKLEQVARSEEPRTPVLGCRISKALEPEYVNSDFMTSRVNWVVQSSAVDYLHLMLVCMRWLLDEFQVSARFAISIHDEVRYLVESEDRYRAALALQITNLLTRSLFAYKLGMKDLPQSVAFFSAIDIDTCMRKEVTLECKTPSNPHGMERGYKIPQGEALDIQQILEKTGGSLKKRKKSREVEEVDREDVTQMSGSSSC